MSEQNIDTENTISSPPNSNSSDFGRDVGKWFFKYRDYTPIPLIFLMILVSDPSVGSASIGILMICFGELLRIYSVAFIGTISRTRSDSTGDQLMTQGPFAYVRNPLYVANFFIAVGFAVFSGAAFVVFLTALAAVVQYHFVIQYEESTLLKKFGSQYTDYCNQVHPWFIGSLPKLENIEWPDNFSPALKSEKRTLTAILVIFIALLVIR
jgi:protein-S-isoprenylcysteine O-methyltransferase Ste14